jgi:hypothetical protein
MALGGVCPLSASQTVDPDQVSATLDHGIRYLLSNIDESGLVKDEYPADSPRYGGETALTAYALLTAQVNPQTPALERSLQWLLKARLRGTYARSMRLFALSEWNSPLALPVMESDARFLLETAQRGAYGEMPGDPVETSSSSIAVQALWAASQRGAAIPPEYWKQAERYWLDQQQSDGGWGFRKLSPPQETQTYGSATAGGLAAMFVLFDTLHRNQFNRPGNNPEVKPIENALQWMAENFSAEGNPRRGRNWWYYWLYTLGRVGTTGGYKYFGSHNWYDASAFELLRHQQADGSWGLRNKTSNTAFAVLFLARGRSPILLSKLKYPGRWNARPRDAAHLAEWISWNFERPVSWQVLDIENTEDWYDAPILYISGSGPVEFTDEQIRRLREYALRGGLIVSEAAGINSDFTLDLQKIYGKMFPEYPLTRLAGDDPIYTLSFKSPPAGLGVIRNDLRPLVVHSPRDFSLALQLGDNRENRPWFERLANLYLMATDKGQLHPRGVSYWPKAQPFTPVATVRIAPLLLPGLTLPEPMAWDRLKIYLGNRHRIRLDIDPPVELANLSAKENPMVVLSGTQAFMLGEADKETLRRYFRLGGKLVVDSAGGDKDFDESVYRQILDLPPQALYGPIASQHPIYRYPETIDQVQYRRDFALTLGTARHDSRLRGIVSGDHLAIVYSPDDLTAGLVGYAQYGLRGYTPETAISLMTNILCHFAGITAEPSSSQPASAPQR